MNIIITQIMLVTTKVIRLSDEQGKHTRKSGYQNVKPACYPDILSLDKPIP